MTRNDMNLSEIVEQSYGIRVLKSEPISIGYTNKNYLIDTNNGSYVLRLSPSYKIPHLPYESYVLDRLQNFDTTFKVPRKVNTRGKDFIPLEDGRAITLFEFIPGSVISTFYADHVDIKILSRNLGIKVGELHDCLSNITPFSEFTQDIMLRQYFMAFESYKHRQTRKRWEIILNNFFEIILDELRRYIFHIRNPQKQIVHTDLRLENILFSGNEIVGILDFDDIFTGNQIYDLSKIFIENYSYHAISPNPEESFDIDSFREFLGEYIERRKMNSRMVIYSIADFLTLPAIHVLSIIGRDEDFDDNLRVKNIERYITILQMFRDRKNINWFLSSLECVIK